MEMREYCHGFHSRATKNVEGLHGQMGDCGHIDKVSAFPSGEATYTMDNWAHLYLKEIVRLH